MNKTLENILITIVIILIVCGAIYGLFWKLPDALDSSYTKSCEKLAANANIETQYTGLCRIKVCNVWVNRNDLPYHLNSLANGCQGK